MSETNGTETQEAASLSGPKDSHSLKRSVERLSKNVSDAIRNITNNDGIPQLKDEIESAKEDYRAKGEEAILEGLKPYEQAITKIGMAIGLVNPVKAALKEQKKLSTVSKFFMRQYQKANDDIQKIDQDLHGLQLTLGKTYALDKSLEVVINIEQDEIVRLEAERGTLLKSSAEYDGDVEKQIEDIDTQINAKKTYLRRQDQRRKENVLNEKRIQKALEHAKRNRRVRELEAQEYHNTWYKVEGLQAPVQDLTDFAQRKEEALKYRPVIQNSGRKLGKLQEIIDESNSRLQSLALQEIDWGFQSGPKSTPYAEDLEDAERQLDQRVQKELTEMRERRERYYNSV